MSSRSISLSVIAALAALGLTAKSANAAYTLNATQSGTSVLFTGSGTLNVSALTYFRSLVGGGTYWGNSTGSSSLAVVGSINAAEDQYNGTFIGPKYFGTGPNYTTADSGTGDAAGYFKSEIFVPSGYTSGDPLSGTATFLNSTFTSLGITPGSYTESWGSGATADSFTFNAAPASVPEPTTFAALGIPAAMGLLRRRRQVVA